MTSTLKTLALAAVLTCVSGVAAAQDYNNWGVIDLYGLQTQLGLLDLRRHLRALYEPDGLAPVIHQLNLGVRQDCD